MGIFAYLKTYFTSLLVLMISLATLFADWLTTALKDIATWVFEWAIVRFNQLASLLPDIVPLFPSFGLAGYYTPIYEYFEYANYFLPVGESIIITLTCMSFVAMFAAVKFMLKLIPGIG